ncbi:MAG: MmgE/PrpD family protein [Lachnospiraceae bacterium]|nr:MmgE/PrpD family protein [Lachnospiraceae bacterium]
MNDRVALKKLLSFIQDTSWDTMSDNVRNQAKKCFLDLAGVITTGAKNNSSKKAAEYVRENYPSGDCTVLATGEKSNLIGAALANGMAANALDLDDGYSLLRGHPGAGFFGALITAAEKSNCTYGELLAALVVAYEVSIRDGYTIRNYYGWDHSSGSYSTFGTAAAVGKLMGLSDEKLEMAISIADFITPVVPAKRSTFVPSMNKDGIYFGQHAGTQAVVMAMTGITGRNPVILDDEYIKYIDTLGETYYMFDLYIKFYSCCRWAHSPMLALSDLIRKNGFTADDVESIDVYSFGNAGTLYRKAPTCEDEAMYNIIYPIAAILLFGKCGPIESSTDKMLDPRVPGTIEKIHFHREPEYDKVFPGKRFSRVEVTLKDGRVLNSGAYEPRGDVNADVSIEDLKVKLHDINDIYAPSEMTDALIDAVLNTSAEAPAKVVLEKIKELAITNIHPEIRFI